MVIAFVVLVIWSLTDKDPVINPKWFITVTATPLRLLMLAYLVQGVEYFPYIVWWLFGDVGRGTWDDGTTVVHPGWRAVMCRLESR
ncbi:hypothetical protein [Xylella fastidiosa]|uniref:Uncharacterized protein n=1 Tax=Xylella fastidiosa subsp. sandyi Ann-1 TaxID=155920 RepID=A0A060H2U1_XYLFS|nr:hypothetical protein [Xylella fastidiosa]AIC11084.1 hypothetical protein D934_04240 [Xylella fastidiosa subsp. sandyi Ann-1]UIX81877.1 hypothetical protein LZ756_03125 [Xylella fastidiosa subsp. sandyi]